MFLLKYALAHLIGSFSIVHQSCSLLATLLRSARKLFENAIELH